MSSGHTHLSLFQVHRSVLVGLAYRMLGSISDAEDVVQEAWLKWEQVELDAVEKPKQWLLTVVSRLSLDLLKSARRQREHYYGTWLPEPFLEEARTTTSGHEIDESVSIALLLVLEKLSPMERAGFLLHDVFGYSFEDISAILAKSEMSCRKMVSRARLRVRSEKPRFSVTHEEHETLLKSFLEASREGSWDRLKGLLLEDVTFYSDGGGKAVAVPRVIIGPEKIARFFINIGRKEAFKSETSDLRFCCFNGVPGALLFFKQGLVTAFSLDIQEGKIAAIFAHRNPDKLKYLEAFSDADVSG